MKQFLVLLNLTLLTPLVNAQEVNKDSIRIKVDQFIQPYIDLSAFSGNLAIAKNGKLIYVQSFGMADQENKVKCSRDTKFYIGSNSKTFTAVAILQLVQQGKINLQDKLSKFISDFPQGDKITIHQLLSHTSGLSFDLPILVDENADPSAFEIYRSLNEQILMVKQLPLDTIPGAQTIYSNNGYRLLAYIIEKVSGLSYGQFLSKNIFRVHGLKNTGHNDGKSTIKGLATGYFEDQINRFGKMNWNNKIGHASIYSTIDDMILWYQLLLSGKVLNDQMLTEMTKVHSRGPNGTYGYGLFVVPGRISEPTQIVGNGRSPGFSAEIRYFKESSIIVCVLANLYSAPVGRLTNNLGAIGDNKPYQKLNIGKPVKLNVARAKEFVGTYVGGADFFLKPGTKVDFIVEGEKAKIIWKIGGGRQSNLIPLSDNSFFDKSFWSPVSFEKDENGNPRMVYISLGKPYNLSKVSE